jgi:hypothetical protein
MVPLAQSILHAAPGMEPPAPSIRTGAPHIPALALRYSSHMEAAARSLSMPAPSTACAIAMNDSVTPTCASGFSDWSTAGCSAAMGAVAAGAGMTIPRLVSEPGAAVSETAAVCSPSRDGPSLGRLSGICTARHAHSRGWPGDEN